MTATATPLVRPRSSRDSTWVRRSKIATRLATPVSGSVSARLARCSAACTAAVTSVPTRKWLVVVPSGPATGMMRMRYQPAGLTRGSTHTCSSSTGSSLRSASRKRSRAASLGTAARMRSSIRSVRIASGLIPIARLAAGLTATMRPSSSTRTIGSGDGSSSAASCRSDWAISDTRRSEVSRPPTSSSTTSRRMSRRRSVVVASPRRTSSWRSSSVRGSRSITHSVPSPRPSRSRIGKPA